MKRWLAGLLALIVTVTCCACAKQPTNSGSAEELDQIIHGISIIPVGTMGVSFLIATSAVELLNWCECTIMSDADVASAVKSFYDTMEINARETFLEQLYLVVNSVGALSREESRGDTLALIGLDESTHWSERAFSLAASIDDLL